MSSPPFFYFLPLHAALPIFLGDDERLGHGGNTLAKGSTGHTAARDGPTFLALPRARRPQLAPGQARLPAPGERARANRKSTRLNSSHTVISYAVFCLKKKKT